MAAMNWNFADSNGIKSEGVRDFASNIFDETNGGTHKLSLK
jgi:hypothetical protein